MTDANRTSESGMALVMVMGILAVSMLILVHVLTFSEVVSKECYVEVARYDLRYLAEAAEDHTFWMHSVDRRLYANRQLGQTSDTRTGTELEETWMADRRAHRPFATQECNTYIGSAETSFRVGTPATFKSNIDAEDTEQLELVTNFLDVLADYTDSDSLTKANGKDAPEYQAEGLLAMPRNAQMRYKEEFYWLPDWQHVLKGDLTIIPPDGKKLPSSSTKPNFFTASEQELRTILRDLTDAQIEQVLESRDLWSTDGTEIQNTLDAELLLTIKSKFSFTESRLALYTIDAHTQNLQTRFLLHTTRECDFNQSTIFADKASQSLSIWKRIRQ